MRRKRTTLENLYIGLYYVNFVGPFRTGLGFRVYDANVQGSDWSGKTVSRLGDFRGFMQEQSYLCMCYETAALRKHTAIKLLSSPLTFSIMSCVQFLTSKKRRSSYAGQQVKERQLCKAVQGVSLQKYSPRESKMFLDATTFF